MANVETSNEPSLRTPIVAVLGHVDHGKTTLLDRIRGSAITEGEPGAITQHIGATAVPLSVISDLAGQLVDPTDFDLPGLLFIDTPGHHSFATLRSRGGALADIAILVVDIMDGFQPQTLEAIDILRRTETPFVVAANKIDTVPGWNPSEESPIQSSYEHQSDRVRETVDDRLYELIGELSDSGFPADFYWRVNDFRNTIGVVPLSAVTGEGIPDLLTVLMGLSQRYMREEMTVDIAGPGMGTVLEVKEERGLGTTIDVVVYNGTIQRGDQIVVGGVDSPIVTDVRALLQPRALEEIRAENQFEQVETVTAAAGVKIAAPDLDSAMAGAPVRVTRNRQLQTVIAEVEEALAEFDIETEDDGVVVKADTLGSLEAISDSLQEIEVPIMRAEVGVVAPRDITVASTNSDPMYRAVLGFSVDVLDDARQAADDQDVELFDDDVIYRLVEDYEEYVAGIEASQQSTILENITRPARFRILRDHVFRQNNPAVVGVEILAGTLRRNVPVAIVRNGDVERIGTVQGIQSQGDELDEARSGEQVSVAIEGPTIGRGVEEEDELWVDLPEKHAKILEQELREELPADEREALQAYLEHRRRPEPFWAK